MIDLRSGYKQIEGGVIPIEWDAKMLSELVKIQSGIAFASEHYGDTGPILLTPGNFRLDGGLYFNERNKKHFSGHYLKSSVFDKGNLVVVMTDLTPDCDLLGKPAFIDTDEPILHNQRIGKVVSQSDRLDLQFLYWHFLSHRHAKRMKDTATGSTVRHTSNNSILQSKMLLPKEIDEQQAIAKALGDVDGLIAALEALIAKKRDIKQGAMQDLLSAHRRLPGFTGEWANVSLKAISAFITKGSTPTTYGFGWVDNGILFLRSECVSKDGLELDQSMMISEEAHGVLSRSEIKAGDLLITITGNVGRVVFLDDGFPDANINQHIARIRISHPEVEARFVYHYLKQDRCLKYFNSITTGQAYPQLSLRQVRDMIIPLPRKDEQSAISVTLSSMDAEIAALETKLAKTRDVKQGMMQVLLTGEVRLV